MTILLIKCSSSSTAQQVVADVEAGELWGVDMGTTSKVAAYSNYCLIECTETRHLNLFDAEKDPDKFEISFCMKLETVPTAPPPPPPPHAVKVDAIAPAIKILFNLLTAIYFLR